MLQCFQSALVYSHSTPFIVVIDEDLHVTVPKPFAL